MKNSKSANAEWLTDVRQSLSRASSDTTHSRPRPDTLTERWTHMINYQQLVASASISLVQFWRYPYIAMMDGGWSSVLVYLLFTVIFGYPMHYLELAIGMVTRKSVIKCWDMSPLGRGIGWAMVLISAFTAFAMSILCAYSLGMFVHSFHVFLPWLHCAVDSDVACDEGKVEHGHESPPESFFYNDILNMQRKGISDGLGKIVWELVVYYLISWLIIFLIVTRGIYSYSKLVLFTAVLAFFVIFTSYVAALLIETPRRRVGFGTKWNKMMHFELYVTMAEQVLVEHAVAQGTLVMLGSYNVHSGTLHATSVLSVLLCKVVTVTSAFILSRVQGAMEQDFTVHMNPGIPFILWASLTMRLAGNQFWAALIFFTFFTVSVCTVALLIQTIISNVRGRSADKLKLSAAVVLCLLLCIIGVVTLCTQGGIYILGFLDYWPVSMPRLPVAALTAAVITVGYGQKSFCEDVFFSVDEYPNVFLRICWALCPVVLIILFIAGCFLTPPNIYKHKFPSDVAIVGFVLVYLILIPVVILAIFYSIFRWRIRDIVDNDK